ncbi:MAG TPA: MFS transporter, partial [Ktedonobacterales bacterium]|nr:MFS transporter [Ktedonobacterales bacterium]
MRKALLRRRDRSVPYAQISLAFLALIQVGLYDGAIGVLLPSMRAHYQVPQATIGLIFLCGAVGYIVVTFNIGLLTTRLGVGLFLCLGAAAYCASALAISTMPPFIGLLALAVVLGGSTAIFDAGLNAFIATLPRNTALLNYLHACYGVGALTGPIIASTALALGLGWNAVYALWAATSLSLLAGIGWTYRGWHIEQHESEQHSNGNVMFTILKMRMVWYAALFLLFYVGAEVSMGGWGYTYLIHLHKEIGSLAAGWIVSGYWGGLTLGRLVLGTVAQRIGDKRAIQLCLGGVVVGVGITWLSAAGIGAALGFFTIGFSFGPLFPTAIALMSRRLSVSLVPTAVGFMAGLGSMGAATFPSLAGFLTQQIGLWFLMPFVLVLTTIMVVVWAALQRPERAEVG